MIVALRFLAFAMAGAALAAFLPVAHAASAVYGLPVPLVGAAMLGCAAIAAFITGRFTDAWLMTRPAAGPALLAAACIASVSFVTAGYLAFVAGALALAGAAGCAAAALSQAAPSRIERHRLSAWAAFGGACSTWLSIHFGVPWVGMHGVAWMGATVCAIAALALLRRVPLARTSLGQDESTASSLRAAAIAASLAIVCVAWGRALAATLTPTPTVLAASVTAPMLSLAVGLAIGVWLFRRAWATRVAVPALLLAAIAAAYPVPPVTPVGPVAIAFGGPNTANYASGVLVDVLVALAPLSILAGVAASILASARPTAFLAGAAVGAGAGVVLVSLLGAVPGAPLVAAGVLFAAGTISVPRGRILPLAAAAAVALVSVHAWRLGPLPSRCGVLRGVVLTSRWDADAFRVSVQRSDGTVERSVDSISVSGNGREWHPSRVAAHLGAILSQDRRTALLAGQGRDEARNALLAHGFRSVDEADLLRPRLGPGRGYDLILHRAPILALWGAGGEYAIETYEAARAILGPRGLFVQEVPLRTTPLSHLKRVLAGFLRAFPEGSAWFARGTLLLAGARCPIRVELRPVVERLALPPVYAELSAIGVCRPWDLLGMYLSDGASLASRLGDARPLTDDDPAEFLDPDPRFPFAYMDGLAWLLEGRQGVAGSVVAGTTRGERWLLACRLDRLRKGSGFVLAAQLKIEQSDREKDTQKKTDYAAESLNAATQAVKIDPGDRYAYETLDAVARRFGQTAEQHAKAPPAAPADPPAPDMWTFQPRQREKEVMWLLDRLDTERGGARIETLLTIESLHDATVAPLVAELASDPDPFFRASVAGTIERLGSPAGARAMVELLSDAEWNVRRSAAQALGAVGGKEEVPTLMQTLGDGDASVREAAYRAIGAILKTPLPSFDARGSDDVRARQVAELRSWWERR